MRHALRLVIAAVVSMFLIVKSFVARSRVQRTILSNWKCFSALPNRDPEGGSNRVSLYAALKDWRKRTADELQRPIFRIMSNELMEDIARLKPRTVQQLGALKGVGPYSLRQYGKKIINIVEKYITEDDNKEGIDTSAFWESIMELKKKKPAAKSKSKAKKATAEEGSDLEKDSDSTKEVAKKRPRRKPIPVMTQDAIEAMEIDVIYSEDLNDEQRQAAEDILEGHNVFITGSAGTGKSFLLRYVIQELIKKHGEQAVAVTAPTGIAAINIDGMTIHSFAGIGLGVGERSRIIRKVMKNKSSLERWQACKALVIDEISMLDKDLFELLDEIARTAKQNDMPFGGIQMIVVGDFLQLPPVRKNDSDTGQTGFCFESPVWEAAAFNTRRGTIHLRQVVRQTDDEFIRYLNEVRLGMYTRDFHQRLRSCLISVKPKPTNGIIPTKLYAINKQVDEENLQRLAELPGDVVTLVAEDKWKVRPTRKTTEDFVLEGIENTIPEKINVKVGAQVMLLRNRSRMTFGGAIKGTGPSLVNGSRGRIIAFTESVMRPGVLVPTVQFDNGLIVTIGPVEYTYKAPGGEAEIVRYQVPLKLAWAATVHKSQGVTLTCAELMLDRAFDYGQAYVALSRVKNLDGLWLSTPLRAGLIKAHPVVLDFYGHQTHNN